MIMQLEILPGTGRGTIRRMVEGASLPRMAGGTPSVTRCAGATSPQAGRI